MMLATSTPATAARSRIALRYLGVYLVYLSTVVRAAALFEGAPHRDLALALLGFYGLMLVLQPRLAPAGDRRPWAYLGLQCSTVVALQLLPPNLEILALLYIPLSLQAVLLLGPRPGFAWIGAFAAAIFVPTMESFDWALPGVGLSLLYTGTFLMMGYCAFLIRRSDASRQTNLRLMAELQAAQSQLQALAAKNEEYATAQERGRMARELHDSVTQTIFGMNLTVQTARMLLEREPAQVEEQLNRLQDLSRGAAGEVQMLVRQLRPRRGDDLDLPDALRALIAERQARDGLDLRMEVAGERRLSPDTAASLLRIAQEALNNVAKHAVTKRAFVRLHLASPRAVLEVEDAGAGFDPEALPASPAHVGLAGMKERAAEIGWALEVRSAPGRGTTIRVVEE